MKKKSKNLFSKMQGVLRKGTAEMLCAKLILLLLVFAGIASSCNPEPETYPKELSFTGYSLPETSCQWINLPYDEKVLIINSKTELEKYISCTNGNYPAIDFTKNTLLIASGKTTQNIAEITTKKMHQLSSNSFKLEIEVVLNTITISEEWIVGIVTHKINEDAPIELKTTYKNTGYPIGVPFEMYDIGKDSYDPCRWYRCMEPLTIPTSYICDTEIIIINSYEEMEEYYTCSEGNTVPEIDFSQSTLLLARGTHFSGLKDYYPESFVSFAPNEYSLKVLLYPIETTAFEDWRISILTDKLPRDAHVGLVVDTISGGGKK